MNEILYSFAPNSSEDTMYIYLGSILFVVCAILFFISISKKWQLSMMFSGFIGIMALGIAVFSYWKTTKLPAVHLYSTGISTPEGMATFDKIKKIDFMTEEQFSKYPIQRSGKKIAIDTMRLILVEEYSGKVHVISEHNYPIHDIFNQLKPLVQAYKETNVPK